MAPPHPAPAPTVEVSATGTFQSAPDTAVVQFEISGKNAQMKAAYADAQRQAEQVRTLLRQQGFAPEAAHWSSYRTQPDWDYKQNRLVGYTVTVSATLEVSDFAKLGPLLDAAGSEGLTSLRGVNFELKNMDAAKSAAIADGYRQVRQEAGALARAAGVPLDGLVRATVDVSSGGIRPMVMGAMVRSMPPAPTEEFTPQEITVSARVSATFAVGRGRGEP